VGYPVSKEKKRKEKVRENGVMLSSPSYAISNVKWLSNSIVILKAT
jgi:hypothetical protein